MKQALWIGEERGSLWIDVAQHDAAPAGATCGVPRALRSAAEGKRAHPPPPDDRKDEAAAGRSARYD
jgi:hypothetical protein